MSFCLDTYLQQSDDYTVFASKISFKEAKKIINQNSKEVIHVKPGDKILGVRIIGIPPIPVGINEDKGTVVITYTKPCHGTAAIELPVANEDIEEIRELKKRYSNNVKKSS